MAALLRGSMLTVKAREKPNLNEDYLEITRKNVALLQIN
jgi:hypothetical protein